MTGVHILHSHLSYSILCIYVDLQTCADDSKKLSDQMLNFVKSHPLMDRAVPAFGGQPVLVQTSLE